MTTVQLSRAHLSSARMRMDAILDATNTWTGKKIGKTPLEKITWVLDFFNLAHQRPYLPKSLQAQLKDALASTDQVDVRKTVEKVFARFYGVLPASAQSPFTKALAQRLPLERVVSCDWEEYETILIIAKEVKWPKELLCNIQPFKAGDLRVVFIGDQHNKIVERNAFSYLLGEVRKRKIAFYYEPLARDPIVEKSYRTMQTGLPAHAWLFGMENPVLEDVYYLIRDYCTLLKSAGRKPVPVKELMAEVAKADGKSGAEVDVAITAELKGAVESVQNEVMHGVGDMIGLFLARMSYMDSFKNLVMETAKKAPNEYNEMSALLERFGALKNEGLSQLEFNIHFGKKEFGIMFNFLKQMAQHAFSKNREAFSTEESSAIQELFDMKVSSEDLWNNYENLVLIKKRDRGFVKALLDPSISIDFGTVQVVWVGYKHLESLVRELNAELTGSSQSRLSQASARVESKGDGKGS